MIMNLYRVIDRDLVQFDFLVHTNSEAFYDAEITSLGGRIYHIGRFNGINVLRYYRTCKSFFAAHPEYHVVHGHIGSCAALYLKAAKNNGCYAIAHAHSAVERISLHKVLYSIFSFPTRYIADLMLGCSHKAGIARFGKHIVESSKYMDFPNAINIDAFEYNEDSRDAVRNTYGIDRDVYVIGTVGRMSKAKNPKKIVAIFETLVKNYADVYCIWVGSGELENEVKEYIQSKGLEDRIVLTGLVSNVSEMLSSFDCFVFPSLWEGLPVSVVEAQASGLPCVISDTITDEIAITDQVHRMDIAASNEEWAKKCFELCKGRPQRKSYKVELVKAGYSIDESAQQLTDLYISRHEEVSKSAMK